MKTLTYIKIAVLALVYSTSLIGQTNTEVHYIKSTRSVAPLIEKWIAEYSKVNPNVRFQIADKKVKTEDISLSLVSGDAQVAQSNILFFGKYALLPIASQGNPILEELSKKRLNEKRLKELFFEKDLLDEEAGESKPKYTATVYSGNNEVSFAQSFASHFGYTTSHFKGKKISGDDVFLVNAVQNDPEGVTYNALSNIFDLQSRNLKSQLAILPLDIKKEYRDHFSSSSNIDNVLNILETENFDIIPVEHLGFTYQPNNKAVKDFLLWVLSQGKTYNHNYGILNLDEKLLASQIQQIDDKFYTSLYSK